MRPFWRQPLVWVGFALSGLAIGTFVSLFDVREVYASLLELKLWIVPLAAVVFMTSYMVRSLRWQILLRPLGTFRFGQVRDVLLTAFMVNNLLPARLGELVRPLALWKVAGASRRASLATVGLERLFDGILLISMLSLMGWLFEVPPWARRLAQVTTAMIGGFTLFALWIAFHHRSLFALLERALFFVPAGARRRAITFLERFVDGTAALKSPALTLGVALTSVAVWSLEVCVYWTMQRAFSLDLPWWSAALAVVVTNFGIAAPSAPGYVGVFEAACSSALIGLGLNKERALSYAIGVHLMLYVCITGTGLFVMWRLGLRLGDVARQARESDGSAAPADATAERSPGSPGD